MIASRIATVTSFLLSPRIAALAAGTALLVVVGCNMLEKAPEDHSVLQEGTLSLPPSAELDMYFKVPYQRPPDMTITGSHNDCVITEQTENHFRIRNKNPSLPRTIDWKARGEISVPGFTSFPAQPTPPPSAVPGAVVEEGPPPAKLGPPK